MLWLIRNIAVSHILYYYCLFLRVRSFLGLRVLDSLPCVFLIPVLEPTGNEHILHFIKISQYLDHKIPPTTIQIFVLLNTAIFIEVSC